jgi:hypothetical protein
MIGILFLHDPDVSWIASLPENHYAILFARFQLPNFPTLAFREPSNSMKRRKRLEFVLFGNALFRRGEHTAEHFWYDYVLAISSQSVGVPQ